MSKNIIDLASRYDQFQSEAVANILSDYRYKPAGRFLLVIPTGGGKTFTAVKAINRLFQEDVLNPQTDRVVWAAHRQELLTQAKSTFEKFHANNQDVSYISQIHVIMINGVRNYLKENKDIKIVVIDEAHRSAGSNIMYGPLFDYPNLGILGLTATPSRHDGKPLNYDKESYSIGFPDLVEKQIILNPEIREIEGGRFDNVSKRGIGFDGLEQLETSERDDQIINHIIKHHEDYRKIIIFVGSVGHIKSLWERMNNSSLTEQYDSIDYIHGGEWTGGGSREDFINKIKDSGRSIVINFDILTEGYDDPSLNTVVMARPSQSKLVYMQAVGRAIRVNDNDPSKTAYIVEVVDNLPNIRYRINNRWLFSEISDTIEPAVKDEFYGSAQDFSDSLRRIYSDYNVDDKYQIFPNWDMSYRYSILLFRSLVRIEDSGEEIYCHFPILIDNENRMNVSNWFNFLSERMENNRKVGLNAEAAMQMSRFQNIMLLEDRTRRQLVYEAMNSASEVACSDHNPKETNDDPWVTFIALRYRVREISIEMQDFISDMVNRDQIENQIKTKSYVTDAKIVKFPLPLSSYIGQIITPSEFNKLNQILIKLKEIKESEGNQDHRNTVRYLLDESILPLNMIYRDALPTIVREDAKYYLTIK